MTSSLGKNYLFIIFVTWHLNIETKQEKKNGPWSENKP